MLQQRFHMAACAAGTFHYKYIFLFNSAAIMLHCKYYDFPTMQCSSEQIRKGQEVGKYSNLAKEGKVKTDKVSQYFSQYIQ